MACDKPRSASAGSRRQGVLMNRGSRPNRKVYEALRPHGPCRGAVWALSSGGMPCTNQPSLSNHPG